MHAYSAANGQVSFERVVGNVMYRTPLGMCAGNLEDGVIEVFVACKDFDAKRGLPKCPESGKDTRVSYVEAFHVKRKPHHYEYVVGGAHSPELKPVYND